jgi:hypothetical protein
MRLLPALVILGIAPVNGAQDLTSHSYFALRGTAQDPWIGVPTGGGAVVGGGICGASTFFIVKEQGNPGDAITASSYVRIRGTNGDPWLHVPDGGGPVTGGGPGSASVFFVTKEPSSSQGTQLRLGDYMKVRGTAGDPWLTVPAGGGQVTGGGPGGASVFRLEDAKKLAEADCPRQSPVATGQPSGTQRVELGWTYITPCNRNILEFADQRAIAYAEVSAANASEAVRNAIRDCALTALGTCGLSTILASPASCQTAFAAAFTTCMSGKAAGVAASGIKLGVDYRCEW